MERDSEERTLIRRYLLGETTEVETEDVEKKMMSDDGFFNMILSQEEELVEQYAQGHMTAEIKERFEQSFLSNPDGQDEVAITKELLQHASGHAEHKATKVAAVQKAGAWSIALRNPYLRIAMAVLIFAAIVFGVYRAVFYRSDVERGLAELRSVYKGYRPIETRLTEFDYAPWLAPRGNDNEDRTERETNRYAERLLLDAIHDHPGAESYHALGVFYLTEQQFEKAIAQFELSASYAPPDAKLHNDWGAALLEKGKQDRSIGDLGKSLEEFNRCLQHLNNAIKLDSSFLEALFNRALLFQEMMLPTQAVDDLRNYLEKDPKSKWADEARQKLKSLEEGRNENFQNKRQALQGFLSYDEKKDDEKAWASIKSGNELTGSVIVNELLDELLALSANGRSNEEKIRLQKLSYIGELELRKTNDRFTSDLAQFYGQTSHKERMAIVQARKLLERGHSTLLQGNPGEAAVFYTQAMQIFEQCRDLQFKEVADYWLSLCLVHLHKEKEALPALFRLDQYCKSKSYQWLRVRCLYLLSGLHSNLSEQSKAIDYGKQALSLAQQIGDEDGALKAVIPLIDYYRNLGNYDLCLSYIGMSLSFNSLEPIQSWRHYWFVASSLYYFGLYEAAIEYERESVRKAAKTGIKSNISLSYVGLGMIYGKIGNFDEALENNRRALEMLESDTDEKMKQDGMAYSYLQRGHIYRQARAYNDAILSYDKSIELYDKLEFRTHLYQAHKGKLFCYIENDNDLLVKDELQTTLGLLKKYRSKISEDDDKSTFFDVEQSTYDLAIDFEYSRMNNPQKAFEYSEESRSRSLLDLIDRSLQALDRKDNQESFKPRLSALTLPQVMAGLPEKVQILEYTLLEKKLLIWLITNSSFESVAIDVTQKDLTDKVLAYLEWISSVPKAETGRAPAQATELFDVLIKPVESSLKGDKQIYIVPDKVLNFLPFDTLVSSASNKYLIEEYLLTVAPSSSIFVACTEIARKKAGAKTERVLSVGNPSFDRAKFPTLADLASAKREAEEIAEYYDLSCRLTNKDAKKSQVMREMEKADVIHLALHSMVNERYPSYSKLILAKESPSVGADQDSDEVMQTYELYKLNLRQARLAVLSACQTGAERYYRGEGMISIARPFIAAGVPVVVASLWPVDSQSTARLMVDFHKYRKRQGASTAESLRQAQLKMLRDTTGYFSHPYYWAGFIMIGGYSDF